MFRRARLSVKPNVRPSAGARAAPAAAAAASQRGPEPPRPPEPAAPPAPPPPEPARGAPAEAGPPAPRDEAPRSGFNSDEKPAGENEVEEPSKPPSAVPPRRKRLSSTGSLAKPSVGAPSEPQPAAAVSPEAPAPSPAPAAEKQPCSDRYRIYKAQKLREMLKEELRKEKKQWKNKYATSESQRPPDRSKMTMRDFIYYLPDNNPMTSSLEQEKRTERPLPTVPTREQESKVPPDTENNEDVEEADEGPLLVPRVKVAEDGSIILDEESLTVEVLRTKGPCVVEENDPIFERGSTTTYSSFRKNYYSKPWSNKETDMFFLAISMVGTDFSMIGQLFPHRARIEIKNKFKREEKTNGWRIDKAFQEKRPFDFDFFAHLLQKVLAEEEKRKQKTVKSQPSKEKSSKPQKNVKVKKVPSEGVSEEPAECTGARISDADEPQGDAPAADEQPSASSGRGRSKRRKKSQEEAEEAGKQAVGNHPEHASAQPEPPEGERDGACQSLRPEAHEEGGRKEQVLVHTQDSEDGGFSAEEVERRAEPVLSPRGLQDAETLGPCVSDSPPPGGGGEAWHEPSLAAGGCAGDRAVDAESKGPEADQVESVKPKVRGRLQRPKPNLSRAVGKKAGPSQSKALADSKSSHPEASTEKSDTEKDETNTVDVSGAESTEGRNATADAVPDSSEKPCLQEDDPPKASRPARPVRGRLQRPKPNVCKAAGRRETPPGQERKDAKSAAKSDVQACAETSAPEQVEDQSCEISECEDVSRPETGDPSQNMQLDDPEAPDERVSIQEDNTSNKLQQVPVLKTRFQKPKPNVGRGARKREMPSEEEGAQVLLVSEKMTAALREIARLEISPRDEAPAETDAPPETTSCLKEPRTGGLSPKEKGAESVDTPEEMDTDLREAGVEVLSGQAIAQVTDVIEGEESGLVEVGVEIPPRETGLEATEITEEGESDLKETGAEISPSKMGPEVADITEEKGSDLKESGEEITPCQGLAEVIDTSDDLKETGEEITLCQRTAEMMEISEERDTDMKESGEEMTPCHRTAEMIGITEEREADMKESGEEMTPCQTTAEMRKITEKQESGLKETGEEMTPYQRIEMIEIPEEKELDLKEIGETTTPCQRIETLETTEEKESDLKEIGETITPCQRIETMETTEEKESDLKEIGETITPWQRIETMETTEEKESDLKESEAGTPCHRIAEESKITEERETNLGEMRREGIPQEEDVPNEANTFDEVETDLNGPEKEISRREKAPVWLSAGGERESLVSGTEEGARSPLERAPGKAIAAEEGKVDLKEAQGGLPWVSSTAGEIGAAEETAADLKAVRPIDASLREDAAEKTVAVMQTEADPAQDNPGRHSSGSLNASGTSIELLPMVQAPVGGKTSSETETSSSAHSSQNVDCDKVEGQRMRSTDPQEQLSAVGLSQLRPEEQKPAEVKPVPFVRSRFQRPKPNLARAALKRETAAARTPVPGQKSETARTEGAAPQQSAGQLSSAPSQRDVAPLGTAGERDESCPGTLPPCERTERGLLPTSPVVSGEEREQAPAPAEDVAAPVGSLLCWPLGRAPSSSTLQREMKESAPQAAAPVRGRLQRPRPNVRKAGQRPAAAAVAGSGGTLQDGPAAGQRAEAEKKFHGAANSQLGTEIEVVSSKISECRMNDVSDEQKSQEHRACAPSPAPLVRRPFQRAKPNLGRARGKKEEEEECGPGRARAAQSKPREPGETLPLRGASHTQLLGKERSELQASLETTARRDCAAEPHSASKGAESELRPSASAGERAAGAKLTPPIVKEPPLSDAPSCPQILKESSYSKIALDRRTAGSSASERELEPSERRLPRKIKSNAPRGRGSKRVRSRAPKREPRTAKATLVTLRASQEEEDDDADDFELDYEEESCHLAPEEVNKAPVFVPIGLRSPEPVAAQIEETMEELEITVNAPDVGCIAVVEHELLNTDVSPEEMKQDVSENMLTVEVTTSEHTQNEAGPSDGSAEAAIALLTMGDLVLQSEMSTEQGGVGICVLPDVQSGDKNHIPFSPDHVSPSIAHESQDLPPPGTVAPPPPLHESQIVVEGQSATGKMESMEKATEETLSNRNVAPEATSNLRRRSRFAKPKVNLQKILGTNRVGAHPAVPTVSGARGGDEAQRGTETNTPNAVESEEALGAAPAAERREPSSPACGSGVQAPTGLQLGALPARNGGEEAGSQPPQVLAPAPPVSASPGSSPHVLGSSEAPAEGPPDMPPNQGAEGASVLTLHATECLSTGVPETQEENVLTQDLAVSVAGAGAHPEDEAEHTFILTLVEIPPEGVEQLADPDAQLGPSPLLPAPILVKSGDVEETSDLSVGFPLTSVSQDASCLPSPGRASPKPPTHLADSRKRVHWSLDERDSAPPAKRGSAASADGRDTRPSEVRSTALVNVFAEAGVSPEELSRAPTSGSVPAAPKPQDRQLEPPTLPSLGSRSLDRMLDRHREKAPPHLPQHKTAVSDKEGRTPRSEYPDNRPSSSRATLTRPGRRPLGFLSLICSKSSLESDEPAQFHKKKRPKPVIPVSRQNLKRSNPSSESHETNPESSHVLPSPGGASPPPETLSGSAAASQEEERKSGPNPAPREEPTSVSEFFLGDIFIEVDEAE